MKLLFIFLILIKCVVFRRPSMEDRKNHDNLKSLFIQIDLCYDFIQKHCNKSNVNPGKLAKLPVEKNDFKETLYERMRDKEINTMLQCKDGKGLTLTKKFQ